MATTEAVDGPQIAPVTRPRSRTPPGGAAPGFREDPDRLGPAPGGPDRGGDPVHHPVLLDVEGGHLPATDIAGADNHAVGRKILVPHAERRTGVTDEGAKLLERVRLKQAREAFAGR